MNVTAPRKSVPVVQHFALKELLPEGYVVAVYRGVNTVSILSTDGHMPKIMAQKLLAPGEFYLLVPILTAYPHYCPSEVLLASLNGDTGVTNKDIERCRNRLKKALDAGRWSDEMDPVRNILSRVRAKTRRMGINILCIVETGYILQPYTEG